MREKRLCGLRFPFNSSSLLVFTLFIICLFTLVSSDHILNENEEETREEKVQNFESNMHEYDLNIKTKDEENYIIINDMIKNINEYPAPEISLGEDKENEEENNMSEIDNTEESNDVDNETIVYELSQDEQIIQKVLKEGLMEVSDKELYGDYEMEIALKFLDEMKPKEAYKILMKISETSNPYQASAQYLLGMMKLLGIGVPQDIPQGLILMNFSYVNYSKLAPGFLSYVYRNGTFGNGISLEGSYQVIEKIWKEATTDSLYPLKYFEGDPPKDFLNLEGKGFKKIFGRFFTSSNRIMKENEDFESSETFLHMLESAENQNGEIGGDSAVTAAYYYLTGNKGVEINFKKVLRLTVLALKKFMKVSEMKKPERGIYWEGFDDENDEIKYLTILADTYIRSKTNSLPNNYIISPNFNENELILLYSITLPETLSPEKIIPLIRSITHLTKQTNIEDVIDTIDVSEFIDYKEIGCTHLGLAWGILGSLINEGSVLEIEDIKVKRKMTRLMYMASTIAGCSMGFTGLGALALEEGVEKYSDENSVVTKSSDVLAAIKFLLVSSYCGSAESMVYLAGLISHELEEIYPNSNREKGWSESIYRYIQKNIELGNKIALKSSEGGLLLGDYLVVRLNHEIGTLANSNKNMSELIRRMISDPFAITTEEAWNNEEITVERTFWRYMSCAMTGSGLCATNAAMLLKNRSVVLPKTFTMNINIDPDIIWDDFSHYIQGHRDIYVNMFGEIENIYVLEREDAKVFLELLLFTIADLDSKGENKSPSRFYRLLAIKQHPYLAFLLNESKILPLKALTNEQRKSIKEIISTGELDSKSFIEYWASEERKRIALRLSEGYNTYGIYLVLSDQCEKNDYESIRSRLSGDIWPHANIDSWDWLMRYAQLGNPQTLNALYIVTKCMINRKGDKNIILLESLIKRLIFSVIAMTVFRLVFMFGSLLSKLIHKLFSDKFEDENDAIGDESGNDEDGEANDSEGNRNENPDNVPKDDKSYSNNNNNNNNNNEIETGGDNEDIDSSNSEDDKNGDEMNDSNEEENYFYKCNTIKNQKNGKKDKEMNELDEIQKAYCTNPEGNMSDITTIRNCLTLDEMLDTLCQNRGKDCDVFFDSSSDGDFMNEPDTISSEFRGIQHSASDVD